MNADHFAREPTVKIFASPDALRATPNRIAFSRGTLAADNRPMQITGYADDAVIPHSESLLPDLQYENACWGEHWTNRAHSIGILRLYESEIICALQPQIKQLRDQQAISGFDFHDPFLRELMARIADVCSSSGPYHYHRLSDDPAGRETVSIDTETGKYVGLHIDAWDQLPEADTLVSANRLCINFGAQDRTFLFVSQSLDAMQEMVGMGTGSLLRMTKPQIGRLFLTTFPDYPVTKLLVRPGEAYLAPTGLLLHDASTKGTTERVMHAAVRGHFDLKNQLNAMAA